jgi:hypothetical protein
MKIFSFFLKTLLYGWLIALRDLWRIICQLVEGWWGRQKRGKVPTQRRCIPINEPAFVRPEPFIYDQYYMTNLGFSVTWDNPDIQLYLNGIPVSSSQLQIGTTYEVVARVWNNSPECPVVNMPVAFSFLEFGVGTVSVPIGSTHIDLGVKGGSNCPAFASMLWTTPTTAGHYCLQVQLQPVDDSNSENNLGQENTDVGAAHSPAIYTFTLRNDTDLSHIYRFVVDAYTPGAPDPCNEGGDPEKDRQRRMARHKRGTQPIPPGWEVKINPDVASLTPGQSIPVTVTATPPSGFIGSQTLNVNAFHEHGLAGGVTLTVMASQ